MIAPAPWVRSAPTASGAILLDLREGRWIGINSAGAAVWNSIAGDQPLKPNPAGGDVQRSVAQFEANGLVVRGTRTRNRQLVELEASREDMPAFDEPRTRVSDLAGSVLFLLASTFLPRSTRLETIVRLLSRGSGPCTRDVSKRQIRRFARISAATARSPLREVVTTRCLERSLAVVLWSRVLRIPATWCLGARTVPFAAHAWAEVAGHSIVGDTAGAYIPLLRVPNRTTPPAGVGRR